MSASTATRRAAVAAMVVALALALAGAAVAVTGGVDRPASAVTASVDRPASGLDGHAAGTRVAAHDQSTAVVVAASEGVSPGEGRAATTPAAKEVVGSRVAPSTAAARPRFAVDSRGAATELRPGGVVEVERIAPSALKPNDAVGAWDDFLGPGPHSNIHPRTGLADPNRLVSADGTRSIRHGAQEMGGRPTRHHFHQESWAYDQGLDVWWVDNLLVRVPLR